MNKHYKPVVVKKIIIGLISGILLLLLLITMSCYSPYAYVKPDGPPKPLVSSWPRDLMVYNDTLYFEAAYGTNSWDATSRLYAYDGVNPPEIFYKDQISYPRYTVMNNQLIIDSYINNEEENLYSYDGTTLSLLLSLSDAGLTGIYYLMGFNNCLYFDARSYLWKYDFINDPSPVYNSEGEVMSSLEFEIVYNNHLFFSSTSGGYYTELWKYDGVNPAVLTRDINESGDSNPGSFCIYNNKLFFSANDGIHGRELWMIDGSSDPVLFYDLNPGSESSFPYWFTEFNGKLYFSADDGIHGDELWSYDEVNGPVMVYDSIIENGLKLMLMTTFNNKLYFTVDDEIHGGELWVYDGVNPPSLVYDIYPGSDDSFPTDLTVFRNKLYFTADDGAHGIELWSYDGVNDPAMVYDIIVPYEWP